MLDANPDFVTEKDNFSNAFFGLHGGVIEYVTNATVSQVDPANMQVYTNQGVFKGDVVDLIPRQKGGKLIVASGLANATEGRFAGVNVLSYASTVAGAEGQGVRRWRQQCHHAAQGRPASRTRRPRCAPMPSVAC